MGRLSTRQKRDLTKGIECPTRRSAAGMGKEEREEWLEVVRELLLRGISTVGEMRACLNYKTGRNVAPVSVENWMALVHKRWAAETIKQSTLLGRREELYQEMVAVGREAWRHLLTLEDSDEHPQRALYMRIIQDANKRKASLCGFDQLKIELKADVQVETHSTVDVVARVQQELKLGDGALAQLGAQAAKLLSPPADPDAIDAEVVEVRNNCGGRENGKSGGLSPTKAETAAGAQS